MVIFHSYVSLQRVFDGRLVFSYVLGKHPITLLIVDPIVSNCVSVNEWFWKHSLKIVILDNDSACGICII